MFIQIRNALSELLQRYIAVQPDAKTSIIIGNMNIHALLDAVTIIVAFFSEASVRIVRVKPEDTPLFRIFLKGGRNTL